MKLGGCQENFKVTLLERPPEKSYSTSKLPSWRGLQKNHAQLHNFQGKSLVKFSRRQNFKIIMLNFKFTKEFSVIRKYHDLKASEARRASQANQAT